MRCLRTVLSLAALVLMSSGIACKQSAGDRCELDSDCSSGLICKGGLGHTDPQGGMCAAPDVSTVIDAGVDSGGGGGDLLLDTAPDQATASDGGGDVATGDAADATAADSADDSGGDAGGDSAAD